MKTKWKFETEDKDYSFFIYTENNDFEEAFNLAYEAYGPQVHDMYYWIVKDEEYEEHVCEHYKEPDGALLFCSVCGKKL